MPLHLVLDHLVFATVDLEIGVASIASTVGVRPQPGGRHPAWGTHNALLGLEDQAYLEVVGPDPEAPAPPSGRLFGVDRAGEGALVTWAVRVARPAEVAARAAAAGVDLGALTPGRRARPDGTVLEWVLSDPAADRLSGVVPFVIDWGASEHPSVSLAAAGCIGGRVTGLRVTHPNVDLVQQALEIMAAPGGEGLPVDVVRGEPALEVRITTPRGRVVLSSTLA